MTYTLFLFFTFSFADNSLDKRVQYCSSNTVSGSAYEFCMESRLSFNELHSCRRRSRSSGVFINCLKVSESRNLKSEAIHSCANTTLWNTRFIECLENIN